MRRFCLLIATLFLIGCSTNASLEPTMVVGETSSALEPSPVAAEATATVAPTDPPKQPSPTEQAGPSYLPPADQAWLRSDSRLTSFGAQTVEIDLQALGLPEAVQRLYVAPNGQYAAYIDMNNRVNLVGPDGAGTIEVDGQATSLAFSPKSDYLAISTIDEGKRRWQLQAYDLAQGSLSELASSNEANRMAVHLLDWTDAGILLDRLLWATDAPPVDLALFVPEKKEFLPIFAEGHFSTAISRDGEQVAVSTGYVPIGEIPSFDLSLINRSSGASIALREMGEGYLRSLSFSPDGSQLFYAFSKGYGGEALTLVLYSIVSGQSQSIELSYANPQEGLKDAIWHDNNTLLIAVADAGKTQVLQLGIDQFSSDGLRLVYEEPRPDQQNWTELVYTP